MNNSVETSKSLSKISLSGGGLQFTFLNSGDLYQASHGDVLINQVLSNAIDGSFNNVFLRLFAEDGTITDVVPLLGIRSQSRFAYSEHAAVWEGSAKGVSYKVVFRLSDRGIWFWDIALTGDGVQADLVYGQDIGIANRGAVRSNESYVSQYIGHSVFEDSSKGYVICSRQNQPQQGKFPYIQQGALTGAIGYATDGFQLFGLSYKETNEAAGLKQPSLANEVYQYEFAYAALQTERIQLKGSARAVFYGLYKDNHADAVAALEYGDEIAEAWAWADSKSPLEAVQAAEKVSLHSTIGQPLMSASLTEAEIEERYPSRQQEEWDGETLLSFFTPTHEHVVLKEKELRVERPHGHIMMTGNNDRMNEQVLATTSFMYGIFNSHIVVGNTSFNKMMSNARNALNMMKTSGQRIYVELEGSYRLLTLPSVFEIGFNYAKWVYKLPHDQIVVTSFTTLDTPEVQLQVVSENGKSYRYLVTNQVTMDNNEYEVPFQLEQEGEVLTFRADDRSYSRSVYPDLCYRMKLAGASMNIGDERLLAEHVQPGDASLVVLRVDAAANWSLTIQGLLNGEEQPFVTRNAEEEAARYRDFYDKVMNGFDLSLVDGTVSDELEKVNTLAWWYTHNMLVHFSTPHGLEQYGGAAWGSRDVCQGPVEYFMATQKYDVVRTVLQTVFSHQYEDTGNWPQWFMYDKYSKVQSEESHGDIIVWPLKVIGDYLNVTKDYSILEEQLPYTNRHTFAFTEQTDSLLGHVLKEIEYIKGHFLHGTSLSSYGDGDWDDTLQPANAQLKKYLVSSWTVSLTYQVMKQLAAALADYNKELSDELSLLAAGIQADFNQYMLPTGTIPGFLYMENPEQVKLMIHPDESETGIQYRLLPMTRSMIGELLTKEQAYAHYDIIKEKLYFPDGVRLMNKPAAYNGGVSTRFKRAEQASNFGREIGLQYVHAHIRFVEAMAKLGFRDEAWKGLQVINPVGLRDVVPNAEIRQSNAYFSSSDGKFNDRYEAQERFEELRQGKVQVKGGWRVYSSGPGIYMNQLISNCLGIRQEGGDLVIDPVLPNHLNGLRFEFRLMDQPIRFVYHLDGGGAERRVTLNGAEVSLQPTANRYRQGGVRVNRETLLAGLRSEQNVIEIYM
ncbi:GH36-type glycosyl hydrolase domain-containing protein [Paenibacillus sp. BC26]|uniref:GH36-type glycosyl hydrolase domain-containing protein n=1 Tax=Paenibacillus sp. BC26 TaxID=1881032 RepID=UPI0008EC3231|nr:cellobiose phosphorylase [Paenibacillus sp. BC26]SFT02170.1 Cellobiose phosphorylase [Paenibacillus sp. BC26]